MTPPRKPPADKPADKPAAKPDGPRPGNLKFRADGSAVLVIRPSKGTEGNDNYVPALVAELVTVEHPGDLFDKHEATPAAKIAAEAEQDSTTGE
jgi:hypothetical protein